MQNWNASIKPCDIRRVLSNCFLSLPYGRSNDLPCLRYPKPWEPGLLFTLRLLCLPLHDAEKRKLLFSIPSFRRLFRFPSTADIDRKPPVPHGLFNVLSAYSRLTQVLFLRDCFDRRFTFPPHDADPMLPIKRKTEGTWLPSVSGLLRSKRLGSFRLLHSFLSENRISDFLRLRRYGYDRYCNRSTVKSI